jgi:hypothetical protein
MQPHNYSQTCACCICCYLWHCREETEEGWKISWDAILHLPGREERAAERAALQQGACPRELIRRKKLTNNDTIVEASGDYDDDDDEALDVVPGFDDDDGSVLQRASTKGSAGLGRSGSGGGLFGRGRASLDVVADHVLSLLGLGHHSSPSNEMQQDQQQQQQSDAASHTKQQTQQHRRGSLELPSMQLQQQRQRRRSMGQQHLGARSALQEEMHGVDGRSASFSQGDNNAAAASWSAIPYTGTTLAMLYANFQAAQDQLLLVGRECCLAQGQRFVHDARRGLVALQACLQPGFVLHRTFPQMCKEKSGEPCAMPRRSPSCTSHQPAG